MHSGGADDHGGLGLDHEDVVVAVPAEFTVEFIEPPFRRGPCLVVPHVGRTRDGVRDVNLVGTLLGFHGPILSNRW